jgi:23S rRNA (guanosine2251-2'-O)-methyltransferase
MSDRPLVYGARPVLELLERRGNEVERVFVARERRAGVGRLLRMAREAGVPISHLSRAALARQAGQDAVHQGVAALVAAFSYADPDQVCRVATAKTDGLLVMADRVVDPRNLGAIVRTAAGAAVDGILLAEGGGVGLTPVAVKGAAGAVDLVPVARVAHPARRLAALRESGFTALVLDAGGEQEWHRIDLRGRIIIVAGGEARGARPGIQAACDGRVAIRLARGMNSLNVAVALGVLLFEAVRQRSSVAGGS